MILKSRRSPVPEHNDKNNRETTLGNGLVVSLVASNNSFSKRLNIFAVLLIVGLFTTLLNFYALKRFEFDFLELHKNKRFVNSALSHSSNGRPIVWIAGKRIETGYLNHVIEIFERLGFQRTFNGSDGNFDVVWSHEYPFMNNFLPPLKSHQRVNHFPGSGFITNKVNLATSELKHIPKAFSLPDEKDKFLIYAVSNPEKLWVQKDSSHRGIKVKNLEDLNLDASGTFVQEYIRNPLLIDGKKFDIGLYVTMTSINPLRLYIYDSDALLRFCGKPYYPFNTTDLDTYVVGDDYTPTWEMPSLKKYFIDLNLNMKHTLNSYLRSIGKDPTNIWKQMEDSIKTVYYTKEEQMLRITANHKSTRNFFEMVRFDFALDDDLNVFLMEANMSPNLSSSHFGPNKLLYEQVIFNLLSLVGLARTLQFRSWNERPKEIWNMMVSDKELSVYEEFCSDPKCHLTCKSIECSICFHCMTDGYKQILKDAILEENSKWNYRRLIPSISDEESELIKGNANKLHLKWFKGKCLQDKKWCV